MRSVFRRKMIAIATLGLLSLSVASSAVSPTRANLSSQARLSPDVSLVRGPRIDAQPQDPAAADASMFAAVFALGALIARRRTRLR
jgi:hypothetical protein